MVRESPLRQEELPVLSTPLTNEVNSRQYRPVVSNHHEGLLYAHKNAIPKKSPRACAVEAVMDSEIRVRVKEPSRAERIKSGSLDQFSPALSPNKAVDPNMLSTTFFESPELCRAVRDLFRSSRSSQPLPDEVSPGHQRSRRSQLSEPLAS